MRILAILSFFLASAPLLAVVLLGEHGLAPMLKNPIWVAAALRSLLVAEFTVPIALLLAIPAALALWGTRLAGRRFVIGACALPILLPPSWSAAGLMFAADTAGLPDGHVGALIAAHAAPAASLAFLVIYGFLTFADPALLQVAAANGASAPQAWRLVVLPHLAIAAAVAAAAALASAVGLSIVDTALASASHPTLGTLLAVAVRTSDAQTASAALILAILTLAPLGLVWCLLLLRRL